MLKKAQKTNSYAHKALYYYSRTHDDNYISLAYSAKAVGVRYMLEIDNNKAYKDSVKFYLYKAMIPSITTDKIKKMSFLNMANYYMKKILYEKNELESDGLSKPTIKDSLNKYFSLIKQSPKPTHYQKGLLASMTMMEAMVLMDEGSYQSSEEAMLKALTIFQQDEMRNRRKLLNTAMGLKDLALKQNDYKKAFKYLQMQYDYNDLIFNKQQEMKMNSLEAKYENEKIKAQLDFSKKENKSKQIQVYLVVLLLLFLLIAIFFMYRNNRNKILADKNKILLLKSEKKEVLDNIKLEQEKYARLLAERQLLKIEKEKVEKKAMLNALQIKRKNEVLKRIQLQLEKNDNQLFQIRNTLKIEKYTDEKIKHDTNEFNEINPRFFELLKQRSNKLTPLDLSYCAYIYLGLSNKEIASNFNVESKSVRMKKYRLKKKLKLDKQENLEDFLSSLA